MKQQNCNYITCYRRKEEEIFIYLKDGTKLSCSIQKGIGRPRKYLSFHSKCNDYLFRLFKIDKDLLTSKLTGVYFDGDWPESKTEKEIFDLLRALIKETKNKYYLETEL